MKENATEKQRYAHQHYKQLFSDSGMKCLTVAFT